MKRSAALFAVAMLAVPAAAQAQVLNFEGILAAGQCQVDVGNFYNGGGGPNYGIEFSANARAIGLRIAGDPGPICSNGSRGGLGNPLSAKAAMYFLTGSSTFMNSATGFVGGFSFFYTAINSGGSFSVWSGLNGTGTMLGSVGLPTTPNGSSTPGCASAPFCPFVAAGLAFGGMAHSVTFAGVGNQIAFDDVTFGSPIPDVTTTPEPATMTLLGTGLFGLASSRMRRRKAAQAAKETAL